MTTNFSIDALGDQPAAIDYAREGFDGPAPGNVEQFPKQPLFRAPISERAVDPRTTKQYVGVIKAAMDVLSARLLGLLAVIGAVGMFAYAVFDPIPWRTYTVVSYALVVLFPTIWLYLKKG